MRTILVTQGLFKNPEYEEVREALDIEWGNLFGKLDYLPVPVLYHIDPDAYFSNINVSGLILTGGNSLSSVSSDTLSLFRDEVELKLIEKCRKEKIPILGICRGAQILAYSYGAQLSLKKGHVGTRHKLKFVQESKYAKISNGIFIANSYHDYIIKNLPDCLVTIALAEDQTVEVFEHRDEKVLGMLLHPERDSLCEDKIIQEMIKSFFN